ncbi:MAG: hypothetical protein RLZZ210_11 [Pseudomonadota bacterium]|jgi:F-type H+-transporting ATPase subunit delta
MLQANTIARPYATALFKIAKDEKSANVWQQTLRELSVVIQDKEIAKLVGNPKVNQVELVEEIKKAVSKQPKTLDSFLQILLNNKRLLVLPYISIYFDKLINEDEGSSDVLIESAFPITKAQQDEFTKYLENKFGRKLNAKVSVVPELVGGMRAFVGDELFDYSIKAQLSNMKAAIMA